MNTQLEQQIYQACHEQQCISKELAGKQAQLQARLTRLNLQQQVQLHGVDVDPDATTAWWESAPFRQS